MSKRSRTRTKERSVEIRFSSYDTWTRTNEHGRKKRWGEKLWALIFHNNGNNNIDGTWARATSAKPRVLAKKNRSPLPPNRRESDGSIDLSSEFSTRNLSLCHRDFGQFADYPRARILIARYTGFDARANRGEEGGGRGPFTRSKRDAGAKHTRDTLGPPLMGGGGELLYVARRGISLELE